MKCWCGGGGGLDGEWGGDGVIYTHFKGKKPHTCSTIQTYNRNTATRNVMKIIFQSKTTSIFCTSRL